MSAATVGQGICDDGCVDRVKHAFAGTAGLGQISVHPGDLDFVVEHDPEQISPDVIATKLVAAGETGACVSPGDVRLQPEKKWVTPRRR